MSRTVRGRIAHSAIADDGTTVQQAIVSFSRSCLQRLGAIRSGTRQTLSHRVTARNVERFQLGCSRPIWSVELCLLHLS